MLSFKRKDNVVQILVEHGINHDGTHFELTINQNHEYQAELPKRQFQKHLEDKLKAVKQEAYNEGWKDAKAKRRKKIWMDFFGNWK